MYRQAIFENVPYCVAVCKRNGVIVDANPAFIELTGYSIESLNNLNICDISLNGSSLIKTSLPKSKITTNKKEAIQDQYVCQNGAVIDVSVSVVDEKSSKGELIYLFIEKIDKKQHIRAVLTNHRHGSESNLSEAQARSILKTAVDGIITINKRGEIHSFNPAAEKMFGYSASEVIGNNISMLMPEPYHSVHDSYLSDYARTKNAKVIGIGREALALRKDQTTFEIHLAVSETQVEGELLYIGVIRDITDLKQVQRELEESEERFRRSQKSANIGTWDWNIKTGDLYWSERIATLFGYAEGELETTYDNFLSAVHPVDRQLVIESVNNCINCGNIYDIEHRVVWPDGTIKWMSERGDVVRNSKGEPEHMLGVVQDITLRKKAEQALLESEERFRGAFESAAHGMAIMSLEGNWHKVNKSFCTISGYSEQKLLSSNIHSLSLSDDLETIVDGLQSLRSKQLESFQKECRLVHKNGETLWVLLSISLILEADGEPLHYICQFIDVSVRRKVEKELQIAKEQAENANQAKSEFLSSMSHELRTPLNAVIGYTELLEQNKNLDPQQVKDLAEIKKAGFHLLMLINDLLDLTKIEARQLELSIETVDLTDIVNECCALVQQQARKHNVTLVNQCTDNNDNNYYVQADRIRTKQIILNLLSNALKYNIDNGSVIISCKHLESNRVCLGISDTGIGIANEKLAQLFQPFNRLGAENSNVEGTGIGLVIAKRLIMSMNGSIRVESTKGQGSTFWLEFQAGLINEINDLVKKDQNTTTRLRPGIPKIHNNTSKPCRLLVIEDNKTNRELLKNQLGKLDYESDLAATGLEGIKLWESNNYDLILTDINLPDIDGIHITRHIREEESKNNKHTPIIAITANALAGDKEKILAAGLDDYINKPVELAILDATLSRWLNTFESEKAENLIPKQEVNNSVNIPSVDSLLDLETMNRYIGDDLDLQKQVLNDFVLQIPDSLQELRRLGEKRDRKSIALEAHKIKSSARVIGARDFAENCQILENFASTLTWQDIDQLIANLSSSYSGIKLYIATLFMGNSD